MSRAEIFQINVFTAFGITLFTVFQTRSFTTSDYAIYDLEIRLFTVASIM